MKAWSESALLWVGLVTLLSACGSDPVPRPRGYFRIDLPEQRYSSWDPGCGYAADLPDQCRPIPAHAKERICWYDLRFPQYHATVHLTYRKISDDLAELVEDAHDFKRKHETKAARIGQERVLRDTARVFGTLFDVEGDVASPMVFYLTDSTDHFLYGALYFKARPNADSLAPVTERLRADMRHFVATLRWTDDAPSGAAR
jgi:gliding motility-associated lipoprotein GldD